MSPTRPRVPASETVTAARAASQLIGAAKQPGRRYGPAPKSRPRGAAAPMSFDRRVSAYRAQTGSHSLTGRQAKRAQQKASLAGKRRHLTGPRTGGTEAGVQL